MTYSQQSHEAAVVRYPMGDLRIVGDFDEAEKQSLLFDARDQVHAVRDDFATNIEAASDHTGQPPLLTAIEHVTGEITELEAARRRLIAYARHGVTGKPYSYASLGAAAGRSDAWAKEQADNTTARTEATHAQVELMPQPGNSIWQAGPDDPVLGLVFAAMRMKDEELREKSTDELRAMQAERSDHTDIQQHGEWLAIQNELNRRADNEEISS